MRRLRLFIRDLRRQTLKENYIPLRASTHVYLDRILSGLDLQNFAYHLFITIDIVLYSLKEIVSRVLLCSDTSRRTVSLPFPLSSDSGVRLSFADVSLSTETDGMDCTEDVAEIRPGMLTSSQTGRNPTT